MGEQPIDQGQQQPQAPQQVDAPAPDQAPGAKPQIPPQVLAAFMHATMAAMKLIYSKPETVQGLLQIVKTADTPQEGIMKAAAVIQSQLAQQAKGGGEVIKRMQRPIAALIAELAQAAGLLGGKGQEQAPQEGEAAEQPADGEEAAAGAEAPAGEAPPPEEGAPSEEETAAEDAAPGEEEEGLVQQKMRG